MSYCTIAEVRTAGGYAVDEPPDADIQAAIDAAVDYIDNRTHRFFEPRTHTIEAEGIGLADLPLEIPPLSITTVTLDGVEMESDTYEIPTATYPDPRKRPKLRMVNGIWYHGIPVVIVGSFGYVDNGTDTPPFIHRSCIKIVLWLLNTPTSTDGMSGGGIVQESYKDYMYRLSEKAKRATFGDQEIDYWLNQYTRPLNRLV